MVFIKGDTRSSDYCSFGEGGGFGWGADYHLQASL